MSKKILTAISGGVDSSVAALILKQKGFEVIGVFMNFWSGDQSINNKCCSLESARFARQVANKLKIRLYILNYKDLFKRKVVEDYLKNHQQGQTPNPCVVCNREIKFKNLARLARNLGVQKIATGHYARIIKKKNNYQLLRAVDLKKDQSYFLWQLKASYLSQIIFPIGELTKPEVRKLAKENNLPTFNKKDSQGLCFINDSKNEFLKKYAKNILEPGNVVDKKNNIIGRHFGFSLYTIGQRAGFEIINDKWRKNKLDVPPLYITDIIPQNNILVVGEDKETYKKQFLLSDLNWLDNSYQSFKGQKNILAQIRYQHKANPCLIAYAKPSLLKVRFIKPERAITPGQGCVFYQKDQLIGGGLILK